MHCRERAMALHQESGRAPDVGVVDHPENDIATPSDGQEKRGSTDRLLVRLVAEHLGAVVLLLFQDADEAAVFEGRLADNGQGAG